MVVGIPTHNLTNDDAITLLESSSTTIDLQTRFRFLTSAGNCPVSASFDTNSMWAGLDHEVPASKIPNEPAPFSQTYIPQQASIKFDLNEIFRGEVGILL
ncbi:hypothetical protein AMTRI_Chr03g146800 [Amborella trichopoda]